MYFVFHNIKHYIYKSKYNSKEKKEKEKKVKKKKKEKKKPPQEKQTISRIANLPEPSVGISQVCRLHLPLAMENSLYMFICSQDRIRTCTQGSTCSLALLFVIASTIPPPD
jgi:hypothetical protein